MNSEKLNASENRIFTKSEMESLYFRDPKARIIERVLNKTKIQYFYLDNDLKIITKNNEVLNGCLLSGDAKLIYNKETYNFSQFDFFFLPPGHDLVINIDLPSKKSYKICLFYYLIEENVEADFEIAHFELNKFVPRGDHSSKTKMATYRTVWTAIKNGYFMSGFTNVPNKSLKQGVITSVNLELNKNGKFEIYPHIHPEYPEVYIMCIDDEKYGISQYLINTEGKTVCRDLADGDGLFFPGNLGHSNFSRPFYKDLKYCMYLWIIPTFGAVSIVNPKTLRV